MLRHLQRHTFLLGLDGSERVRRGMEAIRCYDVELASLSQAMKGGVSLHVAQEGAKASARLSLTSVTAQDAGNYTCQPESLEPAQVTVFVLQGFNVE
ncbi:hypothetical protein O3P69_005327 [Scylla paramamosain]|uniref:Ig-like domain-containing protein n=1 Tax=Scylla paramamosain TaxID=85552 RepID=A0AAW0U826_SCYPA